MPFVKGQSGNPSGARAKRDEPGKALIRAEVLATARKLGGIYRWITRYPELRQKHEAEFWTKIFARMIEQKMETTNKGNLNIKVVDRFTSGSGSDDDGQAA